jgi:hypothetical protein
LVEKLKAWLENRLLTVSEKSTIAEAIRYGLMQSDKFAERAPCRHEPVSADIRTGLCSRAGIPPGKGFATPETGTAIFAARPIPGDRDRAIQCCRGGKAAESQRLFRRRQETGIAGDWVVAEAVLIGPVSVRIFPANREKNREFRENRLTSLVLTSVL